MFTFVTITYNHEKYIIEHLESIKYQIEHFSEGKQIHLTISDDGSQDDTMLFVQQWTEQNKHLFSEIVLLTSRENKGVVKNYLRATENIKTLTYKLLAGDDLYYKNNIFEIGEALKEREIIFTPALNFNEGTVWNTQHMDRLLTLETTNQIIKNLKFENPFNAPATFYSTALIQEDGLRTFISKYKWIEDLPSYYYLFNERTAINYGIEMKPYILYRSSVGISTNEKNKMNKFFSLELNAMEKDFGMVQNRYPKYLNPYRYYWKISNLKLKYRVARNREIHSYNADLNEEAQKAQGFLKMLKNRVEEYSKSLTSKI